MNSPQASVTDGVEFAAELLRNAERAVHGQAIRWSFRRRQERLANWSAKSPSWRAVLR